MSVEAGPLAYVMIAFLCYDDIRLVPDSSILVASMSVFYFPALGGEPARLKVNHHQLMQPTIRTTILQMMSWQLCEILTLDTNSLGS